MRAFFFFAKYLFWEPDPNVLSTQATIFRDVNLFSKKISVLNNVLWMKFSYYAIMVLRRKINNCTDECLLMPFLSRMKIFKAHYYAMWQCFFFLYSFYLAIISKIIWVWKVLRCNSLFSLNERCFKTIRKDALYYF